MLNDYLEDLKTELEKRKIADSEEILQYFEEMINDRLENGESEEEIVGTLDPVEIFVDGIAGQLEHSVNDLMKDTLSFYDLRDLDIDVKTYDVKIIRSSDDKGYLEYDHDEYTTLDVDLDGRSLSIEQRVNDGLSALFGKLFKINAARKHQMLICLPSDSRIDLEAELVSGDLQIEGLSLDDCEIETVSGDVEINNVHCDNLEVKTVSGDVMMNEVIIDDDLEAETVSGDLKFTDIECGDIEAATISGDIEIAIRGMKEDYSIEENRLNKRREYEGGSSSLSIDTVSGTISYKFLN